MSEIIWGKDGLNEYTGRGGEKKQKKRGKKIHSPVL
jgi:hypothetical protein